MDKKIQIGLITNKLLFNIWIVITVILLSQL